jgi:hypothetical protein
MDSLDETFDRLTHLPRFKFERESSDNEVAAIETELNVRLPPQYVRFIKRFGCARWFANEVFGIRPIAGSPMPTTTSNCVAATIAELRRRNGPSTIKSHAIVISTDGAGGIFVLHTIGSPYEGEVHWYNLLEGATPIERWRTLQDYLEYRLKNADSA